MFQGESLLPYPPVTELWMLLYARVQADDADMRNLFPRPPAGVHAGAAMESRFQIPRAETGTTTWSASEIRDLLELLGLGSDTPLSCLVVETLAGE